MKSIYISYKCDMCKKEMVLLQEDVDKAKKKGRYLSCAFCNSKHLRKEKECDSIKQCMKHSSYKRVHGTLRRVHHE